MTLNIFYVLISNMYAFMSQMRILLVSFVYICDSDGAAISCCTELAYDTLHVIVLQDERSRNAWGKDALPILIKYVSYLETR